jgi:hypothetical protein
MLGVAHNLHVFRGQRVGVSWAFGFHKSDGLTPSVIEGAILDPAQVTSIPAITIQLIINVGDGTSVPEANGPLTIISNVSNWIIL